MVTASDRMTLLSDLIRYRVNWQFPLQTRVHPLRSFKRLNTQVFIKREDETGFGISGTKWRKYASLFPFLLEQHFREVVVIGGANSNNVLALAQLLNEYGFSAHYFLRGNVSEHRKPKGNHFLFRILTHPDRLHWVARNQWHRADEIAAEYAETLRKQGLKTFLIPEGASVVPALAGSMTLFPDILRNERLLQRNFDHLIIDSGTGMTAAVLMLASAFLLSDRRIHIVLSAGDEPSFLRQAGFWHRAFEQFSGASFPFPENFKLYPPVQPFGRPGEETFQTLKEFARTEGILTDPVYMAPFIGSVREIIQNERLAGNVLLIHSGGGTGLTGFEADKLKPEE